MADAPVVIIFNKETNTVDEAVICTPGNCEEVFLEKCEENVSNWDEHDQEDYDAITEDGYYETGVKFISLTWAEKR